MGVVLSLSACSTLPHAVTPTKDAPIKHGRMAVQVVGDSSRSFSADFELTGSADQGRLILSSMLGTRLAEATWLPTRVTLDTGSARHTFLNLDQMAQAVFGEPIPLIALFDWLEGRPWPQAPSVPLAKAAPGFEQIGWVVDLQHADEGRIVARRPAAPESDVVPDSTSLPPQPEIRLRIRLDRP